MVTQETLDQFKRLQLESEQVVGQLRKAMFTIPSLSQRPRRPQLTIVPIRDKRPVW
ncbi:MAG TPA: hypothetical protein VII89_04490 [Candidatus Dormibacteraeota bacterium]